MSGDCQFVQFIITIHGYPQASELSSVWHVLAFCRSRENLYTVQCHLLVLVHHCYTWVPFGVFSCLVCGTQLLFVVLVTICILYSVIFQYQFIITTHGYLQASLLSNVSYVLAFRRSRENLYTVIVSFVGTNQFIIATKFIVTTHGRSRSPVVSSEFFYESALMYML